VLQQAGEQLDELGVVGGRQWGEQLVLNAGQDLMQCLEFLGAGRGDGDDVAASVVGVGGPLDEPAGGELVEGRDDVAAVDAGAAAENGLAGGSELLQGGEQPVVVATGVRGGQPLDER
jgi:hypothetical protein